MREAINAWDDRNLVILQRTSPGEQTRYHVRCQERIIASDHEGTCASRLLLRFYPLRQGATWAMTWTRLHPPFDVVSELGIFSPVAQNYASSHMRLYQFDDRIDKPPAIGKRRDGLVGSKPPAPSTSEDDGDRLLGVFIAIVH
jgi:hypothetical protein